MSLFQHFRKGFWHFRHGGIAQLRIYHTRAKAELGQKASTSLNPSSVAAFSIPTIAPQRNLKVGIIADSFTELAFSYEWQQVKLAPDTPLEQLADLDLLFVESAWHGNNDKWQYQLTGSKAPSKALRQLVSACKTSGIPTVFWNKEDPFHFDDFIDTAKLFDWVYTTEVELLQKYRAVLGHSRVGLLQFAAQPVIHNPSARPLSSNLRGTCFAGTYFQHKFPERRRQLDILLEGARIAAPKIPGFDIYARFQNLNPNYAFPEAYLPFIQGELNYQQMLTAYRGYSSFLNVNSVVGSASMFSRRVFELLACATPVISTPSKAISQAFDGTVVLSESPISAARWIRAFAFSPTLREETGYAGQMVVLRKHTYSHRVDQILSDIGLNEFVIAEPKVSVLVATNRPHQLEHVFEQVAKQRGVTVELLICANGFIPSATDLSLPDKYEVDTVWVDPGNARQLGDYYNLLLAKASYPIAAKMDDDDVYGPDYLLEQATALRVMDAQIVGKKTHIISFKEDEHHREAVVYPDNENRFVSFVPGPTLMMRTEFARKLGFASITQGEDSDFLRRALESGAKIWSTSRFGFTQTRASLADHTWTASSEEILAHSKLIGSEYFVN